ncbi:hypothetical protein [Streptomyces sp. NPDC014894]|uniref:hypothetical protein n=1 Tax=Streptomyces sp. NPDC014894 TaxID=3364931 RepID=UPI0037012FCB
MRFRVSAAVVTGAVALTGFAAPSAQADEKPFGASAFKAAAGAFDISYGNTKISDVSLSTGKTVLVGTTQLKKVTATFKAIDPSGIDLAAAHLWRGDNIDTATAGILADQEEVKCSGSGKTSKATCKVSFTIDPRSELINSYAGGGWKVAVVAVAKDGDVRLIEKAQTFNLKRGSQISVNAAPEPVKKGANITVTGTLTRADWEAGKYVGYTKQPVQLQFRKKGAKTFTTVKTVKTSSTSRDLKTTVKATVDGTYRYSFAGTSTTAPVTNGGDFVDVR